MSAAPDLAQLLGGLGDDERQVVANLRRQRILGVRGSVSDCPVAVWLKRHYPGDDVCVNATATCVITPVKCRVLWKDSLDVVRTPPAVAAFITAFDTGEYPELVAEEGSA